MKKTYIAPLLKIKKMEAETAMLAGSEWRVDDEIVSGQGAKDGNISEETDDELYQNKSVWDD